MKRVTVFRHGKQEDLGLGLTSFALPASLTENGRKLAREVARRHKNLLKKCTRFFTSPLIKAQETLFVMMGELGHQVSTFDQKVKFVPGLWTPNPEKWLSDNTDETIRSWWEKHPSLPIDEGKRFFEVIKEIAIGVSENEDVLCISHGGPLDAGLAFAKAFLREKNAFSEPQDLRKGEGVIFCFDEVNCLFKVEELRLSS